MMVSIENISGTNTGASTLNVNGMGELPITGPAGAALQGGEMAVGYGALLRLNHAGTAFTLLATTGGSLPVKAATTSGQAVNLGQADSRYVLSGADGSPNTLMITESTTLTVSDSGKLIDCWEATSDITLTLPAVQEGLSFPIVATNGTYSVSVQTTTGSGLYIADGTVVSINTLYPLPIGSNQSVLIESFAGGTGYRVNIISGNPVVAAATQPTQAVNLSQLKNIGTVTNGATGYSASTTLTSANQGELVFYTGSAAGTFTLPAANALPAYQCKIVISNQSSYPLTLAAPSGDTTDINPSVLQSGQYCCVVNDGNTTWHTLWSTAGSASPVVVGSATASNQAVNLSQLFFGNRKAIYISNGTYTVPAGVTQIWVSGVGGGGGGGGGNQLASGGSQGAGGGGGYAGSSTLKTPLSVTPGQSLTITIGAGGAAGAGTSSLANAGNGSAGGATTIVSGSSTLINLPGGVGGSGANVYNTNYVYGGYGYSFGLCLSAVDSSYAFSGLLAVGGNGQFSPFSTSGGGGGNNNNSGNTGTFGGGGGGGGSTANGGAGGNGYLIIEW
jgi:hypothetical protein